MIRIVRGFVRTCAFAAAGVFAMLAIEAGAAELPALGTEELPALGGDGLAPLGGAEPPALGAESGTIGGLDYSVTRDETSGGTRVCLAAAGQGSSSQELGSIDGSGTGNVCVTVTPPPPPGSGVEDPFSATVTIAIPTPEGVVEADVGTFTDPNEPSSCVALSAGGDGVEPESIEVCLPPDGDETPGLPELPGGGALPEIPECVNPDDGLGLPALPGGPPGLEGLPDEAGVPAGGSLPSLGGDTGGLLDPLLALLLRKSGESPLPGLGRPAED